MKPEMETKVTYGFWGFAVGAGVAMTIGFAWGGWTTSGTTVKMSDEAVLASRAAICVAQFMNAPDHKAKIKELQGTESYQRSELIEKGGWDRMPGQETATWGVAGACVAGLESVIKTGA
ncbi:MAG TPA: hypothetical protein VGA12_02770 [Burkholderiales bacterium]|jgi:hypothetical protein